MNYWDSRKRVIALLESLVALAPKAFEHEVITKIEDAFAVIDGDHSDREWAAQWREPGALAGRQQLRREKAAVRSWSVNGH
jgi:hypothetical protein